MTPTRLSLLMALALTTTGAAIAEEAFPPQEPAHLAEYRQRHNEQGWVYLDTDSGFAFYARNLRREGILVYYEDTTIPLPITENPVDLPEQRKTTGRVNCLTRQQAQKLGDIWETWKGDPAEVKWFCDTAARSR